MDLILDYAVNIIDVITREDVVNRGAFYTVVFNDNVVIPVVFDNGYFVKFAEVTILRYNGDNDIIVEYNGKKCTAIYNIFAGYYVDDIYGVIKD